MGPHPPKTLLLYDGLCGLCNGLVRFLVARDREGRIRFAALQSDTARNLLVENGRDPDDLATVYVVANWQRSDQRLLMRSRAVLHALEQLGGLWGGVARIAAIVPRRIADAVYAGVARIRYRVFGRYDTCALPPAEFRQRFVDRQEPS